MRATGTRAEAAAPVFYYDLGDPECYLAAERVMSALPVVPEWEPVWAPQLAAEGGRRKFVRADERERVERQAASLGLQPIRWPHPWPPDSREAMLTATYAKSIGRAVAFSLAAFRQAFAGGRDLGDRDTILIAGAACEIHPAALLKGIGLRSVIAALERAAGRARAAGASSLPAIQAAEGTFEGEGLIEAAANAMASDSAR